MRNEPSRLASTRALHFILTSHWHKYSFHLSSYPFLLYTTRAAIIATGSFTRANRFGVAWAYDGYGVYRIPV